MESKKYTLEQEQIARFAKAMGHPARMAIPSNPRLPSRSATD